MKFNEETKKIKAIMIIEIIGRPVEYLTEKLNEILSQIGSEKGVIVVSKKINEPILMKDQKDFYTSFAELEIETEQILHIAALMFKYMPAHIEIIEPENVPLDNSGWNEILNELIRKLHGYDEVARILQMERDILERKLKGLIFEKEKDSKEKEQNIEVKENKKQKKIKKK